MRGPIQVIYFHKPDRGAGEPSSVLGGAVLAVVQDIEGVLQGAVRSALSGGLGTIDVEMKRDRFPENVAGVQVTATPEALLEEAIQSTRKKLAKEGLELEAEDKRVSNRTRSARVKLKVRKRKDGDDR